MKFRILLLSGFLAFFGVQSYAQACAAYGYITQSGATVTFNDTSYSQNGHFSEWNYGDGSTAYGSTVSHTYTSNGTYTASLHIYDSTASCDDTAFFTISITSASSCYGAYTYSVDSSNPYKLNFNNTSVGAATAYWWFGGSNSSTQYSPSFTFSSAGNQTVCLTTYDSSGNLCDSICQTVYVPGNTSSGCDATFWTSVSGNTVSFYDSTNSSSIVEWSFGDGSYGYSANPVHTYAYTGTNTFTACLLVYDVDSAGDTTICDTFCQSITISNPNGCNASFGYSVDSTSPFKINFYNYSNASYSYTWIFTDSASTTVTSTQVNPSHTYSTFGYKMVCLTTYDSSGNACDSICKYIYVADTTSNTNCNANFGFNVDSMNMSASSFPVDFYNYSSGAYYIWNFGDGNTDTAFNPSHTYTASGTYTVCLAVVSGYDSLSLPIVCDSFCTTVTVGTSSGGCNPTFTYSVDSSNSNRYYFSGSNPPTGGYATWEIYEGSPTTNYSGLNVTHTFSGSGSISVYYNVYRADSTLCGNAGDTFNLTGASCQASYYLAVDTNNLYNLYIVNNSTGTTSNTNYYWTFGDGSSSTAQYPTHQYASFGLYQLCLTISDSASGCSSTHCDSIGLDSNGNLLKKDGFGITVVDEKDLLSVPKIDAIQGVTIYPNPSTGMYTVNVDMMASDELTISAANSLGQEVLSKEFNALMGNNKLSFDLTEQPNGIYFINLKTGNEVKNLRVYIQK
jgi:PKD repeat protein